MIAYFAAVERGDSKEVHELLAHNPETILNETDYRGRSALHLALERGHLDVANVLIDHRIKIYIKDCGGFTALHVAVEFGHDEIVERLNQFAESASDNGTTALHMAAIKGRTTIVRQLLTSSGSEIKARDKRGKSALSFAVDHGHTEVVAILLEGPKYKTADYGKALLQDALNFGYDHIATQVLAQYPDLLDNADADYRNALHTAAGFGRDAIVGHLLAEHPRLIDGRAGKLKVSVIHTAAEKGHHMVVGQLLALKPELVDIEDGEGHTALHLAVGLEARVAPQKTVECLLAHEPSVVNEKMLWAALKNAKDAAGDEAVLMLLAHKPWQIESVVNSRGNSLLYHVFGRRRFSYSMFSNKLILAVWQMDPNALYRPNRNNQTPFDNAAHHNNTFAIQLVQGKFSIDEIKATVSKYRRRRLDALAPFFFSFRDSLSDLLNRDVVGIVCEYFGFEESMCQEYCEGTSSSGDEREWG